MANSRGTDREAAANKGSVRRRKPARMSGSFALPQNGRITCGHVLAVSRGKLRLSADSAGFPARPGQLARYGKSLFLSTTISSYGIQRDLFGERSSAMLQKRIVQRSMLRCLNRP